MSLVGKMWTKVGVAELEINELHDLRSASVHPQAARAKGKGVCLSSRFQAAVCYGRNLKKLITWYPRSTAENSKLIDA